MTPSPPAMLSTKPAKNPAAKKWRNNMLQIPLFVLIYIIGI